LGTNWSCEEKYVLRYTYCERHGLFSVFDFTSHKSRVNHRVVEILMMMMMMMTKIVVVN